MSVVNTSGEAVREIEVDAAVFGLEPNLGVVHQALLAQQANRRRGTASTHRRSDHTGASKKSFRQKGTGRARMGAPSAHTRVGGAVAFGPHPRSYRQRMPKKMRRLAIRSMLSQRATEDGLIVLDDPEFEPKTGVMAKLIKALGIERSAIMVTAEVDQSLQRSIRNLDRMDACLADTLNVETLIMHDHIVMTESAVRRVEELWGGERATNRRATENAGNS